MKAKRFAVVLFVLMCILSAFSLTCYASDSANGQVTIEFYKEESGGANGPEPSSSSSSGWSGGGRNPNTNVSFPFDSVLDENSVWVLTPDVPMGNLGTLPKTGGGNAIPIALMAVGTVFLVALSQIGKYSSTHR